MFLLLQVFCHKPNNWLGLGEKLQDHLIYYILSGTSVPLIDIHPTVVKTFHLKPQTGTLVVALGEKSGDDQSHLDT